MTENLKATTRRMIPILAQIVQRYLPGYKIEELAAGEKIKAREFSYSAQVYLLMLGQLAHVFSLNELVDLSAIFSGELRRIRGIEAVKLTTFSNANRTRNPGVMRRFFWLVYGMFAREDPAFANPRHKGALAKFRMRGIYAVDSTTIQLAYWCIKWAKHRQRKAAVKLHMVANVANMLPRFAVVGKASEHDSRREEELFASLLPGDVGVLDRAYNNFPVLYRQTLRGVFFVIREKEPTKYRVVKRAPRKDLPKGIISDETIRLTGTTTGSDYPRTLRRVKALVEVKGEMREMAFCTNNFEWSASTVAGLYRARWAVELLFKELKQTLQLQSFFGENQNAVEWQIWAAMLTHLVLRYIKWKNKVVSSYTRFAAIIKNTIWLKRSLEAVINFYCIAPSQSRPPPDETMPYLPGFERLAIA